MGGPRFAFLREWRAMRAFNALDASHRDLVFYSEGSADWPHLGPVVESLLRDHRRKVSYLTSDASDPALTLEDANFKAFQIGSGSVRTMLFRGIDCRHFIMTLPDLETFHLKRSLYPVHYVYLFHSINSTHTAYRKGAFDAYDTILCVGPHHVDEIRKTEAAYGLKAKELVEHGSMKLDTVLAQVAARRLGESAEGTGGVLIAPSWGECSLIERPLGEELIGTLVRGGHPTVLRLHPMTVRRFPTLTSELEARYPDRHLFRVEADMNAIESWLRSDVMISDWSGAATEYAFAMQKPVLYVDTAQKLNNPEWQKIGLRAFEDMIRFEIGHVVEPSAIATLPGLIDRMAGQRQALRERILAARSKWIYNLGRSSQVAAEYLASLLQPGR